MRNITTIFAVWLGGLALSLAQPALPKNVIFKPTFITGRESFTAGTAFVCAAKDGKRQLLVTAHHIFGTAGGFESELAWDQLNEVIKLTVGISMDDSSVHITSKKALRIRDAHALDRTGLANDIAAFELNLQANQPVLRLAKTTPKVGDRLWLYGRQRGADKLELMPCKTVGSNTQELDYEFDDKTIKLAGTSGAPVVNSDGEVVAINIGGTEQKGKLIGYGNPMPSIVGHLEKSLEN